jgi:hypothetical protein
MGRSVHRVGLKGADRSIPPRRPKQSETGGLASSRATLGSPDDTGLKAGGLARQPEGSAQEVAAGRAVGGFHLSSFTTV